MKSYFGYIRVSTAKQGTHGVSLTEQKAAIERYASKNGLAITEWFEERETAAKRGRLGFSRMLDLLRKGKAVGVVIHKIDRSARNLKDWADLGELIDAGVEVHFAADALDLNSRGGRLSADIQAVVAADYIRNLREETRKGFYGRLKQGIYPLGAPIGYLNQGGGKPKVPDPATAPFIRLAFDLYETGRYSLPRLRDELVRRGFRRPSGGKLHVSSLSHLLNNPFYVGIIRLRNGETFRGIHEPLIATRTFERVQRILKGKLVPRVSTHDFTFRRLFTCGDCGRALIGERQKGHVYYRCHAAKCPTKGVREEVIEAAVRAVLSSITLGSDEIAACREYLASRASASPGEDIEATRTLSMANMKARLDRLTDAFVDGVLEKVAFDERRASLLMQIARIEEERRSAQTYRTRRHEQITATLELAENLVLGYEMASTKKKREIVELVSSNRVLRGNELVFTPHIPFEQLQNCLTFQSSAPIRKTSRTEPGSQPRNKQLRAFVDYMLEEKYANLPGTSKGSTRSEKRLGDSRDLATERQRSSR